MSALTMSQTWPSLRWSAVLFILGMVVYDTQAESSTATTRPPTHCPLEYAIPSNTTTSVGHMLRTSWPKDYHHCINRHSNCYHSRYACKERCDNLFLECARKACDQLSEKCNCAAGWHWNGTYVANLHIGTAVDFSCSQWAISQARTHRRCYKSHKDYSCQKPTSNVTSHRNFSDQPSNKTPNSSSSKTSNKPSTTARFRAPASPTGLRSSGNSLNITNAATPHDNASEPVKDSASRSLPSQTATSTISNASFFSSPASTALSIPSSVSSALLPTFHHLRLFYHCLIRLLHNHHYCFFAICFYPCIICACIFQTISSHYQHLFPFHPTLIKHLLYLHPLFPLQYSLYRQPLILYLLFLHIFTNTPSSSHHPILILQFHLLL
ncbi:hypothetical protein BDF19DRAFT_183166 [Syncephalis fuscata]|nr:hypothetical protein BDF19DRAFT_183166 [Syncephalis fuscata]